MKPAVIKYLVTDAGGEQLTPALPSWQKAVHHGRKAAAKIRGPVLIFGVMASITIPIDQERRPMVTKMSARK